MARTLEKVCLARYARATLSLLPDRPTTVERGALNRILGCSGGLTDCGALEEPHGHDGLAEGLCRLHTHGPLEIAPREGLAKPSYT